MNLRSTFFLTPQVIIHKYSHSLQISQLFCVFAMEVRKASKKYSPGISSIDEGIQKNTQQLCPHHRPWDGEGGTVWGVGESSNPGSNVTQVLSSELSSLLCNV